MHKICNAIKEINKHPLYDAQQHVRSDFAAHKSTRFDNLIIKV